MSLCIFFMELLLSHMPWFITTFLHLLKQNVSFLCSITGSCYNRSHGDKKLEFKSVFLGGGSIAQQLAQLLYTQPGTIPRVCWMDHTPVAPLTPTPPCRGCALREIQFRERSSSEIQFRDPVKGGTGDGNIPRLGESGGRGEQGLKKGKKFLKINQSFLYTLRLTLDKILTNLHFSFFIYTGSRKNALFIGLTKLSNDKIHKYAHRNFWYTVSNQ